MSEHPGTAAKAATIVLWVVTVAAGAGMILAGATKFIAADMWTGMFTEWGYPSWFAFVIGGLEVVGALAFLVPRFATYGGALVATIMGGALFTLVSNQVDMPLLVPTVNLIVFGAVAFLRRDVRWTPARS